MNPTENRAPGAMLRAISPIAEEENLSIHIFCTISAIRYRKSFEMVINNQEMIPIS